MNVNVWKVVRAIVGIGVLVMLLTVVYNYWGEYKVAQLAPRPDTTAAAETTTSTVIGIGIVKTGDVNFRTKPDSASKLIRVLKKGEKLTILSKEAGWYHAKDAKGVVGWATANTDYVTFKSK